MAQTIQMMNAGEAVRRISLDVRITGLKVARFRLWLAAQIMKFSGLVAGCEIRIEHGRDFDELPPLPRYRSYMMVGDIEVPRQCSVRHGSPLYTSNFHLWGPKVEFYLDGVLLKEVVSYDLDAGWIRVNRKDANGEWFIAGDEVATEILQGALEVRLAEPKA